MASEPAKLRKYCAVYVAKEDGTLEMIEDYIIDIRLNKLGWEQVEEVE